MSTSRHGLSGSARPFPEVTVLFGDPDLPDQSKPEGRFHAEDLDCIERAKTALGEIAGYRFTFETDHSTLMRRWMEKPPRFVLNFADTGYRNNALMETHIPALLEMLGVPCTGAGVIGMSLVYDKAVVREVAEAHGVPVPWETFLRPEDPEDTIPDAFPALIKPARADGSLGITKYAVVHDRKEATAYLRWLRRTLPGRAALIQEFLPGTEYGTGLIGNPESGFEVLPALEVDYSGLDPGLPRILGYESKSYPDSPYWTDIGYRRARLASVEEQRLAGYATLLFERLSLHDYGRFDFRAAADGTIKLMEVNSNPAWGYDAKLALMTGFAGRPYSWMLERILEAGQTRAAAQQAATAPGTRPTK